MIISRKVMTSMMNEHDAMYVMMLRGEKQQRLIGVIDRLASLTTN